MLIYVLIFSENIYSKTKGENMEKKNPRTSGDEQVFAKEKGLISRLIERLSAKSSSNGKPRKNGKVAATILAGALTLASLGLAGCDFSTDKPYDKPYDGPYQDQVDPETGYSKILTEITTSAYYNEISDRYANNKAEKDEYATLPSAYLKEKFGIDTNKLYENNMGFSSNVYVKTNDKNHVYVTSRISVNDAPDPYYICTTLKYEISDREFEELLYLNNHKAIHSAYFIQELSKQRQPVEEHSLKLTQSVYNKFYEKFSKSDVYTQNVFGNESIEIDWLDASISNQTIYVAVRDETSKYAGFTTTGVIRYMELAPSIIDEVSTLSSDPSIFNGPSSANATDFEKYVNSAEETICFTPPNTNSYTLNINPDNILIN